jgi:hypothetical protein
MGNRNMSHVYFLQRIEGKSGYTDSGNTESTTSSDVQNRDISVSLTAYHFHVHAISLHSSIFLEHVSVTLFFKLHNEL